VDGSSVYVGGKINPDDEIPPDFDAFLRKYDASGNLLWETHLFESLINRNLRVSSIASDGLGGIYMAGWLHILPPPPRIEAFVRKYDASGNLVWAHQFGSPGNDAQTGGIALDVTGVYVVGSTSSALPGQSSAGNSDAYVRKYDANGNVLWIRQFGTPAEDDLEGVAVDATGVYVAGSTAGALPGQASSGERDTFVRRYDPDGNVVWTDQFGTSNPDCSTVGCAVRAATDGAGGVYLVGSTEGALPGQASAGGQDAFVRKYDASGNLVWAHQFGSPGNDALQGVAASIDKLYGVGSTEGVLPGQASTGFVDAFIAKLESDGIIPDNSRGAGGR
jgi:hypothetical protein